MCLKEKQHNWNLFLRKTKNAIDFDFMLIIIIIILFYFIVFSL